MKINGGRNPAAGWYLAARGGWLWLRLGARESWPAMAVCLMSMAG